MKLVHWPLTGGLLHLVQRGRDWAAPQSVQRLAVPNATAHQSTASAQITVLLYNGPLLCGFNVPAMPKLHLFDLLWICCTTSCTTNPRQIDRLQQIHNISTCRDVVNLLYNNSESTTNPQQIEAMEFGFDLLWTCCSVAANQRDLDDVLVT